MFHILLPTDVFPPRCGGAGWSAHALALALIGRGHAVTAIVPQLGGHGVTRENVLGVPTVRYSYFAPNIPFLKNYVRHERLWPELANVIADCGLQIANLNNLQSPISNLQSPISNLQSPISNLIIHAQHVQVTPAAILAGRKLNAPVVVTVRDHWPWDYFATGLHGDRIPYERQIWASLATDLVARVGPLRGAALLPAIPYALAHLRRRQQFLRQANAVIAVSRYIAGRLEGIVAPERLHVIPNMVDLAAIDRVIATPPQSVAPGEPYLLFVGKLERNKGAHLLVDIFRELVKRRRTKDEGRRTKDEGRRTKDEGRRTKDEGRRTEDGGRRTEDGRSDTAVGRQWSVVIAGDGPLRPMLERELVDLGVQARFLDWVDHDEVLRLMAHCELLLFPSAWGEPLSRVPLEASACGAPILAMPTGGTADIITDGIDGALEPTTRRFARRLAELLAQPERRRALGHAARQTARERFSVEHVVTRVEELYGKVLGVGG
jgi:glycosyltransferase involved in cell wall biosynthesis